MFIFDPLFFAFYFDLRCFLLLLEEYRLVHDLFIPEHVIKYAFLLVHPPPAPLTSVLSSEMGGALLQETVLGGLPRLGLGGGQVGVLQGVLVELGVEGPVDTLVVGEDDVALGHHVVTRLVLDLQLEP